MLRKSSLAIALALGPGVGWALSLGSIETHSALNQRFQAVIPVQDLDAEDLDGLKVGIASPVDFARAGLDRPYLLQGLRFTPTVTPNGRAVIQITSQGPLREPFLDFLVEVVWPKGRLLKEYTVLLDPPLTTGRKAPPIAAPQTAGQRRSAKKPVGGKGAAVEATAAVSTSAGVYGPVRRGETLWSIAKGLGVKGAATSQVALALFRENPDAFLKGNINRLRVGARLRVPTPQDILATSRGRARREFFAAANGRTRPSNPGRARPTSQTPEEELRIVTPASKSAKAGGSIEQVKSDLMMVREAGESTRQETEELRGRIRELEAQLADIRRLLALKNDQLAQLAAGTGAAVRSGPSQAEVGAGPTETAPGEVKPAVGGSPESATQAPATTQPPASKAPSTAAPLPASQPSAAQPASESQPLAVRPAPQASAVQPAPSHPAPPHKAPSPPPPESGFLDRLLADSTLLGVVGAVVVVIAALLWLLIRRRRAAEAELQESLLIHPETAAAGGAPGEKESITVPADTEGADDTSFMSDFSPSDIDALHEETGEVDPSSEADVYIAYGRYQQAESLIAQALEKQPDRVELKLKLLEIYFTTRNTAAFVKLAEEMETKGVVQKDPEVWKKVVEMGRELLPSHRLFGGDGSAVPVGVAGAVAAGGGDATRLPTGLPRGAEISELPNADEEPSQVVLDEGTVLEPPGLKDAVVEEPDTAGAAKESAEARGERLNPPSELDIDLDELASLDDIDLGDLDLDQLSEPAEAPGSREASPGPSTSGATNSPASEEGAQPSVATEEAADEAPSEIPEIDLSELETGEADVIPEADLGSLSELLQPVSEGVEGSASRPSEVGDSSSFLATQEEVETKLDLARAYIEMGDAEGAREILGEVLEEGDERQRNQAKDLVDDLD